MSLRMRNIALATLAVLSMATGACAAMAADAPGVVVAMGDSFMSGEGGRWRGNVGDVARFPLADALGAHAYWDTPTGESQPGCHRSAATPAAMLGLPVVNLACSGATTTDMPAQVAALAQVARGQRVRAVAVSVGGNDAGFGRVVRRCLVDALLPTAVQGPCRNDPAVRGAFSDAALAATGAKVAAVLADVRATMADAGYAQGAWTLLVQDYPRVVAAANRYPEGWRGRLYAGGCPFRDADLEWINNRIPALNRAIDAAAGTDTGRGQTPAGAVVVHVADALVGRRLCERGTARVDAMPPGQVRGLAERVNMVRLGRPFSSQESVHPNWLGQRALGACLAQAWNGGVARSGTCAAPADWARVDAVGLPVMRFTATG